MHYFKERPHPEEAPSRRRLSLSTGRAKRGPVGRLLRGPSRRVLIRKAAFFRRLFRSASNKGPYSLGSQMLAVRPTRAMPSPMQAIPTLRTGEIGSSNTRLAATPPPTNCAEVITWAMLSGTRRSSGGVENAATSEQAEPANSFASGRLVYRG